MMLPVGFVRGWESCGAVVAMSFFMIKINLQMFAIIT